MVHVKVTIRICGRINVGKRRQQGGEKWYRGVAKKGSNNTRTLVYQIMKYELFTTSQTMQRKIKEKLNKQRRRKCQ